jgi:hypothetical protein
MQSVGGYLTSWLDPRLVNILLINRMKFICRAVQGAGRICKDIAPDPGWECDKLSQAGGGARAGRELSLARDGVWQRRDTHSRRKQMSNPGLDSAIETDLRLRIIGGALSMYSWMAVQHLVPNLINSIKEYI